MWWTPPPDGIAMCHVGGYMITNRRKRRPRIRLASSGSIREAWFSASRRSASTAPPGPRSPPAACAPAAGPAAPCTDPRRMPSRRVPRSRPRAGQAISRDPPTRMLRPLPGSIGHPARQQMPPCDAPGHSMPPTCHAANSPACLDRRAGEFGEGEEKGDAPKGKESSLRGASRPHQPEIPDVRFHS